MIVLAGFAMLVAQQDRGTLTGTAIDPAGAVAPGVKVVITNTATNARYESATNNAGQFTMPSLADRALPRAISKPPASRFLFAKGSTWGYAQVVRVDAALQLGATTETVEVSAEAAIVKPPYTRGRHLAR
ncbi:MAG: carboxypeptidase-like regulatory domain-containing protein [Bryobacterales bacterium]|nr:carboxypeptidase-like regulatory domain-containing protein [Bryobacterales bacterium]